MLVNTSVTLCWEAVKSRFFLAASLIREGKTDRMTASINHNSDLQEKEEEEEDHMRKPQQWLVREGRRRRRSFTLKFDKSWWQQVRYKLLGGRPRKNFGEPTCSVYMIYYLWEWIAGIVWLAWRQKGTISHRDLFKEARDRETKPNATLQPPEWFWLI